MEILTCHYKKIEHDTLQETDTLYTERHFTSGLNGEVYEMFLPHSSSKCFDPLTPVIKQCVEDGQNYPKDVSEIEKFFYRHRKGKSKFQPITALCWKYSTNSILS